MKIKELLEELEGLDPELDVFVQMSAGCCGDNEDLEIYDVEGFDKCGLFIRCAALPGYRSCIQYGGTLEADKKYWKIK